VLQLDDPHNAQDAQSETKTKLESAVEWWSNTWASRLDDLEGDPGVMLVIGQRIHEDDLIGHLLEVGGWHHLCLPTEYEVAHPLIVGGSYPPEVELPSGKVIQGDPRSEPGELLMPDVQTKAMLAEKVQTDGLTAHVYSGQYQQRPAPREGKLLKRADWRYYDPELSFYRRQDSFGLAQVAELAGRVGEFDYIGHFWDTSVKDTEHSDFASGGVWGCVGAMRFLLRLYHERAALNATIEGMEELHSWALSLWPDLAHFVVIENAANGPDAAKAIRKRVQGVVLSPATGSKWARASAAEPALVGHNCVLPGWSTEEGDSYDSRTPMDVQEFIEELAIFNQGSHDDQVDMWSSMVNWTRTREGHAEMSVPEGQVQPERFLSTQAVTDPRATRVRPALR
jgi:phage terminase large subunit-like protein